MTFIDSASFISVNALVHNSLTKCLKRGIINFMKIINNSLSQREIISVDQLNSMVKQCLETCYSQVWVEGEISNLARPSSGHLYFSLKSHKAQVKCAYFRFSQRQINLQLIDGMQVLVSAKVSLYEDRGDYQLIVDYVEELGDGKLRLEFEQLKAKLHLEGLFDPQHKKGLPPYPKHIGIITSPTGAAIRDILSVIQRRFPAIPVTVYPTQVQGKQSAPEIMKALALAITHATADVLIISRGGGSLEDLWGFNNEALARAIYHCPIPTISGVGHEIDFTITDFVADMRAPTPSAAAELITPDQQAIIHTWMSRLNRLEHLLQKQLHHIQQTFYHLIKRLSAPKTKIENIAQRIDHIEHYLKSHMTHRLQGAQHTLRHFQQQMLHHAPAARMERYQLQWQQSAQKLQSAMLRLIEQDQQKLALLMTALDTVSPLATLARGYSIVENAVKHIVSDANSVSVGEMLTIRLQQGLLDCVVKEKKS